MNEIRYAIKDEALIKASIAHWIENRAAKTPHDTHIMGDSCPLCQEYAFETPVGDNEAMESCVGCPVRQRTGEAHCDGSPWRSAQVARREWLSAQEYSTSTPERRAKA